MPDTQKNRLRHVMREKRQRLSISEKNILSEQILHHIQTSNFYKNSKNIACYYPVNNEVDAKLLIENIWSQNKKCYLPALNSDIPKKLIFLPYSPNDHLQKNNYGILEPIISLEPIIPIEQLDVVFIPLVAIDNLGNRLGMGAGYYDRTFASLQLQADFHKKPLLMGLAYSFQCVSAIAADVWDVKLDGVITESGTTFFNPSP